MCKHSHCALWSLRLFVMANVFLVFVLLSSFQLSLGGPVFLSSKVADGVLRRLKRANTALFEELLPGNLERECYEELCVFEEAREVYEDSDKAMAFWKIYMYDDGDQCTPNPCVHQASCEDGYNSYTCHCPYSFSGVHCEIDKSKRCDLNNGDCGHFCQSTGIVGGNCYCAEGYKLKPDGISCGQEAEFPCGSTALIRVARSLTPTFDTNGEDSLARIVGGEDAIPAEIPWQVALVDRKEKKVFCGGSILSERWVITAAHCLNDPKRSFFVRLGEHDVLAKDHTEQDIQVAQQHKYPLYNDSVSLFDHDLALLHLQTPIKFSNDVRPICIGPKAFTEALVKRASPATVSGWGRLGHLAVQSNTLKKVEVPYTSRTECKFTSNTRITPAMFCAGYYNEVKDACKGDSGGPHANNVNNTWFLTGIVSWGEKCGQNGKYGVYTRLSLYVDWIHNMTHELEHSVQQPNLEDDLEDYLDSVSWR